MTSSSPPSGGDPEEFLLRDDPFARSAMDRPLVSVVVPFHNSEQHIAGCIESLLDQEDPGGDVELIFIDNRSEDDSPKIVARYPQLTVLEEDTPGAYAARNTGIRHVRAPIVALTDADCIVDRDWLRTVVDELHNPAAAILFGACRYPRDASLALKMLGAYENAKAAFVIGRCPPPHHFAWANNMAVRASVFAEIGPFVEWPRAADTELVHRLASFRPDLQTVFVERMRVTHMEFLRARQRARRMALYTRTNARIPTFRELGTRQRLALAARLLVPRPLRDRHAPRSPR
jgi:glycosyltransferase involved in cell wall biosynthesis